MTAHIPFDNSYARLPSSFHARVFPTPVSAPRLIALNRELAANWANPDALTTPEGVEVLSGKRIPDGASQSQWLTPDTSR